MDRPVSILSPSQRILWFAVLGDGTRFEVGESGVDRIDVVQENGAGGPETGDIWLVVSGPSEGNIARVLASRCVISYAGRYPAPEGQPDCTCRPVHEKGCPADDLTRKLAPNSVGACGFS